MKDENDSFTAEIIHIGSAAASKEKAAATRQAKQAKRVAYRAESEALIAQAQRKAEERTAALDNVAHRLAEASQDAKQRAQLKAEEKVYAAIQREKQGMETWLPVSMVAVQFQVTPRRIRYLLAAGRLTGRVQENGYWEVRYPFAFEFGTRGPQLRKIRPAKPELRTV